MKYIWLVLLIGAVGGLGAHATEALLPASELLGVGTSTTPSGMVGDTSWHLLTQSRGGTVSLIKDLTKEACEFSRKRVLGLPATPQEEADQIARYKARREEADRLCQIHSDDYMVFQCTPDGHAKFFWAESFGGMASAGDIILAECFQ
jgi:hypothetical protein